MVSQLVHMGSGSEIAVAGLLSHWSTRVPSSPVLSQKDLRLPLSQRGELGIEPSLDFND